MANRYNRLVTLAEGRHVVLLSWSTATEDKLENVICRDASGNEIWRAKLPEQVQYRDCFTSLKYDGITLMVGTFSGYEMQLCIDTGQCLSKLRLV